jgi:hypothetical protein
MDIEDVWRADRERMQAQKEEIAQDDNPKIINPDKDHSSHAGGGVYGPTGTAPSLSSYFQVVIKLVAL